MECLRDRGGIVSMLESKEGGSEKRVNWKPVEINIECLRVRSALGSCLEHVKGRRFG